MSAYNGDLPHRFTAHAVDTDAQLAMERVRRELLITANVVKTLVPEGREQSLAITKPEEAMFWANAGIAREADE